MSAAAFMVGQSDRDPIMIAMRGAVALTISLLGLQEAREHTQMRPRVKEKQKPDVNLDSFLTGLRQT
ncbi:MAG: hypothetical protein DHS20C06_16180 [Hyphobacterium sp.]|nr:MAG: hypothetical protein DHS20C06_16180 [Hyphobacterium sp.]